MTLAQSGITETQGWFLVVEVGVLAALAVLAHFHR